MPVVKRNVLHGGGALKTCLDYVSDKGKTEGLVYGQMCQPETAYEDMRNLQKRMRMSTGPGARYGYHIIWSFDPRDEVSPEESFQMGKELAARVYPEYQAVVCTHQDKEHVHNHIVLNAMNIKGRKLVDQLNQPEGLYGLWNESNAIALEHGCRVLKDHTIRTHDKRKDYSGPLYDERKIPEYRIIERDYEEGKEKCRDYRAFVKYLVREKGYTMKRRPTGQITVNPPYFGRGKNEDDLPEKYRLENIEAFFQERNSPDITPLLSEFTPEKNPSPVIKELQDAVLESEKILKMTSAECKERDLDFFCTRYREVKRHNRLTEDISFCKSHGIQNETDLCREYMKQVNVYHGFARELKSKRKKLDVLLKDRQPGDQFEVNRLKRECNRCFFHLVHDEERMDRYEEIVSGKLAREPELLHLNVNRRQVRPEGKEHYLIRFQNGLSLLVRKALVMWNKAKGRVFFIDDHAVTAERTGETEYLSGKEAVEEAQKNEKVKSNAVRSRPEKKREAELER